MSRDISLQELQQNPFVAEILDENSRLKLQLSSRPEVTDLKDVPLPYVVKQHVLIKAGVHNGMNYSAQSLRMACDQHEGLSLFVDHHKNDQGGTVATWVGEIRNPVWSAKDESVLGDLEFVDPKTAMAIAYGAKFGVSATVDVDAVLNNAVDPIFKSYSVVLDPAVRETMLNSLDSDLDSGANSERENELMEEAEAVISLTAELETLKANMKPALSKLEEALKRASATKDAALITALRQLKAMLTKMGSRKDYPYPDPKLEQMEIEIAEIKELLQQSHTAPANAPDTPPVNAELAAVQKEKKELQDKLDAIAQKELAARAEGILKKELEIGLTDAASTDKRKVELSAMDAKALDAVEHNLDRTIAVLAEDPEEDKPETGASPAARKELAKAKKPVEDDDAGTRKLLDMMVTEQSKGLMEYGGT